MLNWTERKQKFLSDFFINKKINTDILSPVASDFVEENKSENQNNDSVVSNTWADLISQSKNIKASITSAPLELFASGFKISDPLGQKIFDTAFSKIREQLAYETDYDDEMIVFNIIEYILVNNLHKKDLYTVVKKLKNLTADLLPYDF